jgi:hypothetical protein
MGERVVKNPEKIVYGRSQTQKSVIQVKFRFREILLVFLGVVFLKFLACASIKNYKMNMENFPKISPNMMQNISQGTRPLAALNWTTHMSVTDGISDTSFFE